MTIKMPTCPCGCPAPYESCCGRWHVSVAPAAPDAETLMRSRYSAYVLGLDDYLLATWHASTRPTTLDPAEPGLRWLGLEVRRTHGGGSSSSDGGSDSAEVEFVARSKLGGRAHRLHETSRFVREGGRWFYVDGKLHTHR
jgi:SEC-C motif-containing protein